MTTADAVGLTTLVGSGALAAWRYVVYPLGKRLVAQFRRVGAALTKVDIVHSQIFTNGGNNLRDTLDATRHDVAAIRGETIIMRALQREQLGETPGVAHYECDVSGQRSWLSDQWVAWAGLSREEASGDGWTRAIHDDDREALYAGWTAALLDARPFLMTYRLSHVKTGAEVWVRGEARPVTDKRGGVVGWIGSVRLTQPPAAGIPRRRHLD